MTRNKSLWFSTGGVIAIFILIVLGNFLLSPYFVRMDLTDGKVYTLSDGTRQVLNRLESPVTIRLYFSPNDASVPLPIKGYGRRVEDLLSEYRAAGKGKVIIEKLDPQPDSDAEETATADGVQAQALGTGEQFYLGLAISFNDQKVAIPALSMDRERLLEYDITRAIARTTQTDRPVIGVMSPMPLFGGPGIPQMGMPPSEKSVFISELERDFKVEQVPMDAAEIAAEIRVLIVAHPRGITDQGQYALDQYVMRGGKLVAMIDPYAYFDVVPTPGGPRNGTSSNLETLMKAWGLSMDSSKLLSDMKFLSGQGEGSMPTLLTLNESAYNTNDIATTRLGATMMPFVGALSGTPADGLTQEVLMRSSTFSQLVDTERNQQRGQEALRDFAPSNVEHPIAVRLTGMFKSAFPDGRPATNAAEAAPSAAPDTAADAAKPAEAATPPAHLNASTAENSLVLIADSDFINDGAAVQIQEIFGQRIVVPINGNLAFAQALIEQYAGDPALVSLRSRQSSTRPFTVIQEMEARAQQAYLGKIKELEDGLQQTQERLKELQQGRTAGEDATIRTAEQQAEIDNFRKRAIEIRRELREVRRDLRAESVSLQFWTKMANIVLVPILLIVAGLLVALIRRRRVVTI